MSAPCLQLQGLVAGWQQPVTPVVGFSLTAGEVVGLVGPNGVGKSTVLAAIAGRARVHAGQILRAGGLRVVLQTQDIPPFLGLPLCGRELLALTGASPVGLPAWLAERLDERLDRLSGGQRHFLALWAVLAVPADLILLDEPTNHLDQAGVRHLAGDLRQRAARGAAILVVSHDHDFLRAACSREVHLEAVDA